MSTDGTNPARRAVDDPVKLAAAARIIRAALDRSAARAALLARYTDEQVPVPGTVALRCSVHATFIRWASPPAPTGRVACTPRCPGGAR